MSDTVQPKPEGRDGSAPLGLFVWVGAFALRGLLIPALTLAGVLPPYVGESPTAVGAQSPYPATLIEVAQAFCTSDHRVNLFRGFLSFRESLLNLGIGQCFQWLNGSFFEAIERTEGRNPNDLDVVTFLARPPAIQAQNDWDVFVAANANLFAPDQVRERFGCHAFFVDIHLGPVAVINQTAYWCGVFTHKRFTHMWKGIVLVGLPGDDAAALAYINGLQF